VDNGGACRKCAHVEQVGTVNGTCACGNTNEWKTCER